MTELYFNFYIMTKWQIGSDVEEGRGPEEDSDGGVSASAGSSTQETVDLTDRVNTRYARVVQLGRREGIELLPNIYRKDENFKLGE